MASRNLDILLAIRNCIHRVCGFFQQLGGNGAERPYVSCRECIVCEVIEDTTEAVHVGKAKGRTELQPLLLTNAREKKLAIKRKAAKLPIVAILPKSQYLTKTVEIPRVRPEETASIIRLEIEADIQSDLGDVEISYREVPGKKAGCCRYEAYIARSSCIHECLSSLLQVGLDVNMVVPSAVVWRNFFDSHNDLEMLVINSVEPARAEVSFIDDDGNLSVRAIKIGQNATFNGNLPDALKECIRSAMSGQHRKVPLTIGWLGQGFPKKFSKQPFAFKDLTANLPGQDRKIASQLSLNPFLPVAANSISEGLSWTDVVSSNLLPRKLISEKQRRKLHRTMATSAVAIIAGIFMLYAGIKFGINRHQNALAGVVSQTLQIETEGEAIGRRIEQLEAIRTARSTARGFHDILEGLYAATPVGVTYSNVELSKTSVVRLRGQAGSLSLPFVLPQKLESQTMFKNAVLQDAGQVKKAGGTVAEFRIECKLRL